VVAGDLSPRLVDVSGVLLPVRRGCAAPCPPAARPVAATTANGGGGDASSGHAFIPIPSAQDNLRSLALALSLGASIMLEGATGSGKTSLVQQLARLTGNDGRGGSGLLTIQLSDQVRPPWCGGRGERSWLAWSCVCACTCGSAACARVCMRQCGSVTV